MHQHGKWRGRFAGLLSIAAVAATLGSTPATAATSASAVSGVPLLTVGAPVTLTTSGKAHTVHDLVSVDSGVVQTPSGVLVVAGNTLDLISATGSLHVLSAKATVDGFAASQDGRYVAWTVSPDGPRDKSPYRVYLYDLQLRRLVHSRTLSDQEAPVGFLADGRVALAAESPYRSYLWRPSTGVLAKVGALARFPSVTLAVGHLLVMSDETNGCSGVVKDSRSGKGSVIADNGHECNFMEGLSPDGTRWWSLGLSAIDGRLVAAPGIAAAANGKQDPRLAQLFLHERTAVTDGTWLDNDHLLLIAQRYQPHATIGRQLELLCTIPATAAPSCATVKDLGPYERQEEVGQGPSYGPDVFLARVPGR